MDKNKMDKIRKKFFKDEIMTAITKMIDTPDNNGIYTDYKCLNEIVEISERYWNTELCDAHDALRAMRALNKVALKSSNEATEQLRAKIKELKNALKELVNEIDILFIERADEVLKGGDDG